MKQVRWHNHSTLDYAMIRTILHRLEVLGDDLRMPSRKRAILADEWIQTENIHKCTRISIDYTE
jgi:hypothetical protein